MPAFSQLKVFFYAVLELYLLHIKYFYFKKSHTQIQLLTHDLAVYPEQNCYIFNKNLLEYFYAMRRPFVDTAFFIIEYQKIH